MKDDMPNPPLPHPVRQILAEWQQRDEVALIESQREPLVRIIERLIWEGAFAQTCRIGITIDEASRFSGLSRDQAAILREVSEAIQAEANAQADQLDAKLNAETP